MTEDSDVLTGEVAIGKFLGWKPRTVRYRASLGEIPTFKIGRTRCATKSNLRAWLSKQAAMAEAATRSTGEAA